MNLLELKTIIDRIIERQERRHTELEQIRVCIPIKTARAIGGTPVVDVKSIQLGFDWDNNKLMLYPIEDLSKTDHDYLAKMRDEADKLGWSVYEYNNLKRENKKLQTVIEDLRTSLGIEQKEFKN